MFKECPLVSIIVITYKSSPWVKETLESVMAQTYPNYELIITDDCSPDNTVEICHQWIDSHKDIGKRMELVEAAQNTGVSGNCNRGLAVAKGQWLKFIAGDDMLAPTAIEDYMSYVTTHPNVRHLVAKAIHFTSQLKESDKNYPDKISPYLYRDEVTVKFQYDVIRRCFFGSGPTYFIQKEALMAVGGFDERFPMQEDYPLFIKMIGRGYKMMLLDRVTVYKRMVETSLQYDKNENDIFPKNLVRIIVDYKFQYRKECLGPLWRLCHNYSLWLQNAIISAGNTYLSPKCKVLYSIYKITDPFVWYSRYIHKQSKQYL